MSCCARAGLIGIWIALHCSAVYAQPAPSVVRAQRPDPPSSRDVQRSLPFRVSPAVRLAHSAAIEEVPAPQGTATSPKPEPATLSLDLLVQDVLARHPSLASAQVAWRAAAARYPQVVSLDDPMLDTMMAPASLGSNDVDFAYVIQGRQKLPWSGKRPLRGQVAAQEAQAMGFAAAATRLDLVQAAKNAYFQYTLAHRLLKLNRLNRDAVVDFRKSAVQRYESNLVSRQDVLLADVETAQLDRRRLELERMLNVAIAKINTLLLRSVLAPLPLPPPGTSIDAALPEPDLLQAMALSQRPELAAAAARLRSEQAATALACREYMPDLEVVGRYDTFWQAPQQQLQGQVGVTLNIPLAQARRAAAVREASARAMQRRAEIAALVTQIQFDVQSAFERLRESHRTVALYDASLIPAASASVESGLAGYVAGSIDFLRLVEAQRQLIAFREGQAEAQIEYSLRRADLERLIGDELPLNGSLPRPSAP